VGELGVGSGWRVWMGSGWDGEADALNHENLGWLEREKGDESKWSQRRGGAGLCSTRRSR
jgi:hypothetical protein